jgi:hypothetical protein
MGSISPCLGVRKLILKTCNFIDINNTLASNTTILTALGGSTTTSHPIMVVILRQQLAYLYIVDYGRAVHATPDKS